MHVRVIIIITDTNIRFKKDVITSKVNSQATRTLNSLLESVSIMIQGNYSLLRSSSDAERCVTPARAAAKETKEIIAGEEVLKVANFQN